MRIHSLHHVRFEGLGTIADWAQAAGHTLTSTWLPDGEPLPDLATFDWLIVMGGPMSIHDEAAYPWLAAEKRLVRAAIDAGKTVLGICLGGQLVAHVLGARVGPQRHLEIGWFPVRRQPQSAGSALADLLPESADMFHWHGDTFELPDGAVHLAASDACANQAFAWGDRVLALQFHIETTPAIAAALVDHCAEDLAPGPYVQSAGALTADAPRFAGLRATMGRILDGLAALPSCSRR